MFDAQIIQTGGDDVVVLTRRDYDALLARAGDPVAEDVMTMRILAENRGQTALPAEVMDRILDGENPLVVLMAYRGLKQKQLADISGLSQPFISKLVRNGVGARKGSIGTLARVLGVSPDLLQGLKA